MPTITRAQARSHETALLRLAAGPTRRDEGSRRLRHTATDAAVYAALVSHVNWATGLCCPGYRAIARLARVSLATVSAAIHRLRAAGFLRLQRRLTRVPGHGLRWMHRYLLVPAPEAERVAPRSEIATEPASFKKKQKREGIGAWPCPPVRSVAEQIALLLGHARGA